MVRVVINADDFGRSVTRNQAIDDSFKQGLIVSAGLIVTGKNLENAVEYIVNGDYYDKIHLHVNLSTILSDGDPEDMPLTEAMRENPSFCKNGKFSPYSGLPFKFFDIRQWKIIYQEIEAQYQKFISITEGKGDYKHIDFHLWYNLTWPSSIALYVFIRKHKVKSVRFIGIHQMYTFRYRLLYLISRGLHRVKYIPATNIDYYLSKKQSFRIRYYKTLELYCHPNYKDGVFLDDSPSYLRHKRQPMTKQIQLLKKADNVEFVLWKDVV